MRFKEEARFTPDLKEHRVYHEVWKYCGTLDRTGWFDGGTRALVDLKTGEEEPWHPLQLCAYAKAELAPDEVDDFRKMTVHLRRNGTFKVCEYPAGQYRDYWNTFLGCLTCYSFKASHPKKYHIGRN